jgi:hypothetical protein
LNYASSRCRAAGNALAMRLSGAPEADHSRFIEAVSRELVSVP